MDSQIRFISDFHFGHENLAKKRGFNNADEMNWHIIHNFNTIVKPKDTTFILGDITMEKKKGYELLDELNGYKKIILGNHDRRQDVQELLKYVNGVCSMFKYKDCFLTHCPIHESELDYRVKYNIHGHTHENFIKKYEWDYVKQDDIEVRDPRYINVCAEVIDYKPKTFEELFT